MGLPHLSVKGLALGFGDHSARAARRDSSETSLGADQLVFLWRNHQSFFAAHKRNHRPSF